MTFIKFFKYEFKKFLHVFFNLKTGILSQKKKKKKIAVRFDKAIQEQAKRSGQEKKR